MLKIRDWESTFENNRSREVKKLTYVCVPNKLDGDGFTELLDHKDGAAHYGCWVALLAVASRCEPRGTLSRDGARPHNVASLSRITRISEKLLRESIRRLLSIGWLIDDGDDGTTSAAACDDDGTTSHRAAAFNKGEYRESIGRVKGEESERERDRPDRSADVRAVFAHYRTLHPKSFPAPRSDSKEWKLIDARLAEGFAVADLVAAIDGCHRCPHNLGENDRGQKYLHLELIVRNASNVSRFMEVPEIGAPVMSAKTQKTLRAMNGYLAEVEAEHADA